MGNLSHSIMCLAKHTNAIWKLFNNEQMAVKLCANNVEGLKLCSKAFVERRSILGPKEKQLENRELQQLLI